MIMGSSAFAQSFLKVVDLLSQNPVLRRWLLKILWGKRKITLIRILSFSHNVFYPSKNKFETEVYSLCHLQLLLNLE